MTNLQILNPKFIVYTNDLLTVDVLGGVDLGQVQRMVCTLRITFKSYPPYRTTLDLYSDHQTDKLIRTLCDKWEVKLLEVSKTIHELTLELETYRLEQLKFSGRNNSTSFELNETDKRKALKTLKSKTLLKQLSKKLNTIGIIGEADNAMILFMSLASHKYSNPFSVICLAKSGMGKSYILHKLSECMPEHAYSFHTRISANALYYFDSNDIKNKALLIEDLEWTTAMLSPLATLQSQGRLINTRATKDKDGLFHRTTFQVSGKLCLLACAYSDKNYESLSLPFLLLHLNHSYAQDVAVMDYQKKCKAGLIALDEIKKTQAELKCMIAALENISIINPYAPYIELPKDIAHPRKSLLLLLNFIEVVTYFFQYQRKQIVDENTGEVFIHSHPDDIRLAFILLKPSLFRRADELSAANRGFYKWLSAYLKSAKTNQFTSLDIRKVKTIHPRTLNRYLNELKLYGYIKITGGNKHRGGFVYKLTGLGNQSGVEKRIEEQITKNVERIAKIYEQKFEEEKGKLQQQQANQVEISQTVSQNALSDSQMPDMTGLSK